MRYVERIGRGPNRRYEIVVEPDFLESYSKWPWANSGVCSPMILMRRLVGRDGPVGAEPEEHRARDVVGLDVEARVAGERRAGDVVADAHGEAGVFGDGLTELSNTAFTIAGVSSFDDKP